MLTRIREKNYMKADRVFKHVLSADEKLVQIIVKGALEYQQLDIPMYDGSQLKQLNTEQIPKYYNSKSIVCDLLLEDSSKILYDIEMQNTPLSKEVVSRFHYYGNLIPTNFLKKGDRYVNLCTLHQILFVNDPGDGTGLVKTVWRKDIYGNDELVTHIYTHYIFMPYINVIASNKKLSELTLFEKIIYAIENDFKYGILELEEEVINIMNTNELEYLKNIEGTNEMNLIELCFYEDKMAIELNEMEKERDNLAEQLSDLEKENSGITTQLSETKKERDNLAEQLSDLEKENNGMTTQLSETKKERDNLAQQLSKRNKERDNLAQQLGKTKKERDNLAQELSKRKKEHDDLSQQLSKTKKERDNLAQELSKRKKERDNLAEQLRDKDNTITSAMTYLRDKLGLDVHSIKMIFGIEDE